MPYTLVYPDSYIKRRLESRGIEGFLLRQCVCLLPEDHDCFVFQGHRGVCGHWKR